MSCKNLLKYLVVPVIFLHSVSYSMNELDGNFNPQSESNFNPQSEFVLEQALNEIDNNFNRPKTDFAQEDIKTETEKNYTEYKQKNIINNYDLDIKALMENINYEEKWLAIDKQLGNINNTLKSKKCIDNLKIKKVMELCDILFDIKNIALILTYGNENIIEKLNSIFINFFNDNSWSCSAIKDCGIFGVKSTSNEIIPLINEIKNQEINYNNAYFTERAKFLKSNEQLLNNIKNIFNEEKEIAKKKIYDFYSFIKTYVDTNKHNPNLSETKYSLMHNLLKFAESNKRALDFNSVKYLYFDIIYNNYFQNNLYDIITNYTNNISAAWEDVKRVQREYKNFCEIEEAQNHAFNNMNTAFLNTVLIPGNFDYILEKCRTSKEIHSAFKKLLSKCIDFSTIYSVNFITDYISHYISYLVNKNGMCLTKDSIFLDIPNNSNINKEETKVHKTDKDEDDIVFNLRDFEDENTNNNVQNGNLIDDIKEKQKVIVEVAKDQLKKLEKLKLIPSTIFDYKSRETSHVKLLEILYQNESKKLENNPQQYILDCLPNNNEELNDNDEDRDW